MSGTQGIARNGTRHERWMKRPVVAAGFVKKNQALDGAAAPTSFTDAFGRTKDLVSSANSSRHG